MTATQPDAPGTDLAVFNPDDSAFPVLFTQEGEGSIAEIIDDNFGDDGFSAADLPRVKIPSGGGLAWDIPDEEPSRYLDGVIVHKQPTRSMWFASKDDVEDGEDTPPDCASSDAKIGIGAFGKGSEANPTGECAECPMNVFGTAEKGNGKKCAERMELYVLQEGSVLPLHVSLPVTSATKPWKQYMTRLASKGKSFSSVVTRLGLQKMRNPRGNDYSVVEPQKLRDLSPEESRAARQYGATIRMFLDVANAAREEARLRAVADAAAAEPADQ